MASIKFGLRIIEAIVFSYFGFTLLEFFTVIVLNGEDYFAILSSLDGKAKTLFVIAGLGVMIIKGIHLFKMNKLIREEKRINNMKLTKELEAMDDKKKAES